LKILSVLGLLGSGKTTTLNKLLADVHMQYPDWRVLVIVNDVGETNVDAQRIDTVGDVVPLTAGCIGCGDLESFRAVLADAKQQAVDLVLIEPTGIADGREIYQAVAEQHLSWSCLTLVDVQHIHRNMALGMLPTQLEVATSVGLTWWDQLDADARMGLEHESLLQVGSYAPTAAVHYLASQGDLPLGVNDLLKIEREHHHHHDHGCDDHCDHDHSHGEHDHDHGHNHGVYSVSLQLYPEITSEQLMVWLAPLRHILVRAKGVVGDRIFDYVQGDLNMSEASDVQPFANIIGTEPLASNLLDMIGKPAGLELPSGRKQLLTDGHHDLDATIAAIQWQMDCFPPVVSPDGMLRVDCEADVAYQLAKRQGIDPNLFNEVLGRYLDWRIEALEYLESNLESLRALGCDVAHCRRRLGLVLGWHIAKEIRHPAVAQRWDRIVALRPSAVLAWGLDVRRDLFFDEERKEDVPEMILPIWQHGIEREGLTPTACRGWAEFMARQCQQQSRDDWADRWLAVANNFK
jgi:G3E family GTPase